MSKKFTVFFYSKFIFQKLYEATVDILEKEADRIFSLQEIQDVLIKDVSQK
jgi:hypothetical protein